MVALLVISVCSHSFFEKDRYDTHCEIPISFTFAVLGSETKDGACLMKIILWVPTISKITADISE